jgi:hypothetical protein
MVVQKWQFLKEVIFISTALLMASAGQTQAESITVGVYSEAQYSATFNVATPYVPKVSFFQLPAGAILQNFTDPHSLTQLTGGIEFSLPALAAIPPGEEVTSASLTFTIVSSIIQNGFPALGVRAFGDNDGLLSISDFTSPPLTPGPGFSGGYSDLPPYTSLPGANIPVTLDITSLIQSLVSQGTPFVQVQFSSSENVINVAGYGNGSESPTLTISTSLIPVPTPEPAGIVLMGLGVIGVLAGMRFRDRASQGQSTAPRD